MLSCFQCKLMACCEVEVAFQNDEPLVGLNSGTGFEKESEEQVSAPDPGCHAFSPDAMRIGLS